MDDTASLQNLHDIVVPGPLGWWPPAPGWYVVLIIAAGALLVLTWNAWRRWRRNRYRGEALRELARIGRTGDLRELPVLLKRAALSAWPRESVAGLAGADWHRFLDESANTDRFGSGAGEVLERLAYASGSDRPPSEREAAAVLDAARFWLKRHRAPPAGG
jgi:hypothetical protein